jgi:hypothetical protein
MLGLGRCASAGVSEVYRAGRMEGRAMDGTDDLSDFGAMTAQDLP